MEDIMMGTWEIQHCTNRFMVHHESSKLMVLMVNGQDGWFEESDIEAEIRQDLLANSAWQHWTSSQQGCQELEHYASQASQRVRAKVAEDEYDWNIAGLTAIGMIAKQNHLQFFGAGDYKARLIRNRCVIRELGSPLPENIQEFFAMRQNSAEYCQATSIDWVLIEGGFASTNNPNKTLLNYGDLEVQKGDTIVLAQRSFFNGFYQVNKELCTYQDPPLDWSELHIIGSRISPTDVFIARFAS